MSAQLIPLRPANAANNAHGIAGSKSSTGLRSRLRVIQYGKHRNWPAHALALDMHLDGMTLQAIGDQLGLSRERIRQMVNIASHRLAYRVFYGVPRARGYRFDKERGSYSELRDGARKK